MEFRPALLALRALPLCLLLAACQGEKPEAAARPSALPELFADIAFGREYQESAGHLVRWDAAPRVAVIGRIGGETAEHLARHLGELAEASGLSIAREDRAGETAEMVVNLMPARQLDRKLRMRHGNSGLPADFLAGSCRSLAFSRDGRLSKVEIYIPAELSPADLRRCLAEETAQGLGLFNDAAGLGRSLFDTRDRGENLSATDRTLIRLLYHPDLKPGMDRSRTLAQVRRILDERRLAGML